MTEAAEVDSRGEAAAAELPDSATEAAEVDSRGEAAAAELPDSAVTWLRQQVTSVQAGLELAGEGSFGHVERILDRWLSQEPGTETVDRLMESLTVVMNAEANSRALLEIVAQCFTDHAYLRLLHEMVAKDLGAALEGIVALHGRNASRALAMEGRDPSGWVDFRRYVYRDLVAAEWRVRVIVKMNNGQTIILRDSPDSMVLFAEALLDTLSFIPAESAEEAVSAARREGLKTAYEQFFSLFAPAQASEPATVLQEGTSPGPEESETPADQTSSVIPPKPTPAL